MVNARAFVSERFKVQFLGGLIWNNAAYNLLPLQHLYKYSYNILPWHYVEEMSPLTIFPPYTLQDTEKFHEKFGYVQE